MECRSGGLQVGGGGTGVWGEERCTVVAVHDCQRGYRISVVHVDSLVWIRQRGLIAYRVDIDNYLRLNGAQPVRCNLSLDI